MTKQVVLCADSFSLRYPEALGLEDENLKGQDWLEVFSDGEEAREWLSGHPEVRQVWVVGSDDMEAINLAAGLKSDCALETPDDDDRDDNGFVDDSPVRAVYLVSGEAGDVPVRAQAANLDGVMTPKRFVGCYADEKRRQMRQTRPPSPERAPKREGRRQAVLLPVVSASGGAGKSTVAVLCALAAARGGYRTLLIDGDFQFGNAAELLGGGRKGDGAPVHRFDEVLDGTLAADDLAAEEQEGPVVLAALSRPERLEECEGAFAALLPRVMRAFDAVVVNTPSCWTELHALLIDHASRVLYVLDQRPSALTRATSVLAMCGRCGMATKTITGVLNRCRRGALFTAADAEGALGLTVRELADGGREVEELMALGRAEALVDAYNPLAVSIDGLMADILPPRSSAGPARLAGPAKGGRLRGLFLGRRGGADPCPF